MRRSTTVSLLALVAAVAAIATMVTWQLLAAEGRGLSAQHAAAAPAKNLYTCGMHPQVIQEGPGSCPICGMDLTPLKKGTGGQGKASSKTLTIDPVVVQNMGVRIAKVRRGTLSHPLRTIGEVVVAEDLVSVVNLKFSGWIERLYVDRTGVKVRRGQPLFTVYSPELVSAQEEYLVALRAAGKDSPLARSSRTKLRLFDLSDRAVAAIAKRGKARRTLTIYAPRAGYVLHKNVVQGARALAGSDIFRIGKLSAIWVHAQVYEHDASWIKVGQPATMELSFQRGKLYQGKVSYIYPTLEERTRTLKVRLEFKNPALSLKPGMFTTVRIETRRKEGALLVPTEAILNSGERQLVFVAIGLGKYEARELVTGLSGKGHVTEVLKGLTEGERVVTSGQFLLDSESQLREAVQKLLAARLQAKQPEAKQPKAKAKTTGASAKTYTCPMHPSIHEPKPGDCPICGMTLVEKTPGDKKGQ